MCSSCGIIIPTTDYSLLFESCCRLDRLEELGKVFRSSRRVFWGACIAIGPGLRVSVIDMQRGRTYLVADMIG